MNQRFHEIRNYFKLNQGEFGKRIGLSKASISALESGLRNITKRHVMLLCSEFNVNEHWLRTGEGEMFNEPTAASLDNQLLTWFNALNDSDKISLIDYAEFLVARQKKESRNTND